MRNDIGGHFGSQAAIYAVCNLSPEAVSSIEVERDALSGLPWAKLHCTNDIAATAFFRHLPGDSPEEQFKGFMEKLLEPGFRHVGRCIYILVSQHLWPRFGH